MNVTVDRIFIMTRSYERYKKLIECDWETLIYEHGDYLKCRHCSQRNICNRDYYKIVR